MPNQILKKEKKPYEKLCFDVSEKTKAMRNILNLVKSELFQTVWEAANAFQQERAYKIIEDGEKGALRQWMMMHESIEFGEKTWQALVEHAKWYQIKNYSRLTRIELIRELERVKYANTCKEVGAEGDGLDGEDGSSS